MSDITVKTGALAYSDGSGFEIDVEVGSKNSNYSYDHVILSHHGDTVLFAVEEWPTVLDAIERTLSAFRQVNPPAQQEGE